MMSFSFHMGSSSQTFSTLTTGLRLIRWLRLQFRYLRLGKRESLAELDTVIKLMLKD